VRVIGIAKAYATRVGEGPFPTEIAGELGDRLRVAGKEFGSATGRPRRCGWFDSVAVRYSAGISGASELVLTNLDVLRGFPLKICVAYGLPGGARTTGLPAYDLDAATPELVELPGFTEDLREVRTFDALPAAARAYVQAIEQHSGLPVRTVSVGPERNQVILR
jgi:adenylosuccinate synthase